MISLSIANGGDNVAAYTPVFRALTVPETLWTIAVFAALIALWCASAALYFPKSTDLSSHTAQDLLNVAAELNERPRKSLGWDTPAERLHALLTAS